ncbi:UDP-N-acetylmuramoyl-L-alanyl-D-glutamate--2,6-diaminopimelate ligase [Ktedonospora formicarum]|uniref:UDP-N-acetylmuramyl-tripeptide synthetase n=1 Tax=Ktedonospora formicarum TaxID=2778364 RepID=A0A8J3IDE1_9CHLR|nr:UDP-N-acetylmuramoyl-L-alanyl-D-glutamate--2,6-diaminopimelate ligase [Ktedonospora formicarum]GHO50208.1 UDP-N-acetylmuramyl-tripeptide synthetase [Ktedonospora formicarum]
MRLEHLLAALKQPPLHIYGSDPLPEHTDILGLAYDSRKAAPGYLFIAVPGVHTDGRRFVSDAAQRGAVVALGAPLEDPTDLPIPYIEVADVRAALADLACAFYDYPAQQLCTIGVTGTDGKTTTSNIISTLFDAAGHNTGLMTTANFKLNGQEWANSTRQSTLEALEIQEFLRKMLDMQATHAVIESTSHGLELHRVRGCAFDVGVVTNITHEHLDFHKTLDAYRRAKARLFEMLDPSQDKGKGYRKVAILNRDDSSYEVLKPYCQVPILDYGIDTPAAVRAVDLNLQASRTAFRVILPDAECQIDTPLIGRFNVSNCLAAIATAYSQGISLEIIAHTLATIKGVPGRMEHIDEGQPFSVIVDYAHTADSLHKVLSILRPVTQGKLMVVFGSAGERDVQKRPIMGSVAAQMSDFFVITDEDPRDEDRESILRDIAAGSIQAGKQEGKDFLCIADRREAISAAFERAQHSDTVLLAGKGHEQSIIIGREKLPWDDRQVAREELRPYVQ